LGTFFALSQLSNAQVFSARACWLGLVGVTLAPLAALACRAGGRRARRFSLLGLVAAEELTLAPLWWLSPYFVEFGPVNRELGVPAYLSGLVAVVPVVARWELPEWLFPVRGAWLRRLLATAGLAAISAGGPWWPLVSDHAPAMLELALAASYLLYFSAAIGTLSSLRPRAGVQPTAGEPST
jgi:hypothetical protein